MTTYFIDIGSSTIKVYSYAKVLTLREEHSIYFKNGFSDKSGIRSDNTAVLYAYFEDIQRRYNLNFANTRIFATGIFRLLPLWQQKEIVEVFHTRFDLVFNIISHGIENYYIGKAMKNDYGNKKVMIINMGGKTTELVTFSGNKITDRKNLTIGVAEILNAFPEINEKYSTARIENITRFVKAHLENVHLDTDYDCAIFTGGEERFEKLTRYNLRENTLFNDGIHRQMVSFDDFVKGNEHILYELSMEDLYALMPHNPKWMDGARPGAVLPQAIFEKARIKYIVPSDLNLINGVVNDMLEQKR